jgi:hypothetical protein
MDRRYSRNVRALIVASVFAGAAAVATTAEAQVLALPIDKCIAKKVKCAAKYVGALAKCDAKAASKTSTIDPLCVSEAAAKLTNGTDGCLEKVAAASEDCSNMTTQAVDLKGVSDAYRLGLLCTLDSSNPECPTTNWYRDDDGDGYGDWYDAVSSYYAPEGYVSLAGDCNDDEDFQYPGRPEVCDGLDNDCSPATGDNDVCPGGSDVHVGPEGRRYIFNFWMTDGHSAKNFCTNHGFRLARVDDLNETHFITNLAESVNVLVGGTDAPVEGLWGWGDGDVIGPFINWATNEPNSGGLGGDDEDCMEVSPDGKWNDISCNTYVHFVCERY